MRPHTEDVISYRILAALRGIFINCSSWATGSMFDTSLVLYRPFTTCSHAIFSVSVSSPML